MSAVSRCSSAMRLQGRDLLPGGRLRCRVRRSPGRSGGLPVERRLVRRGVRRWGGTCAPAVMARRCSPGAGGSCASSPLGPAGSVPLARSRIGQADLQHRHRVLACRPRPAAATRSAGWRAGTRPGPARSPWRRRSRRSRRRRSTTRCSAGTRRRPGRSGIVTLIRVTSLHACGGFSVGQAERSARRGQPHGSGSDGSSGVRAQARAAAESARAARRTAAGSRPCSTSRTTASTTSSRGGTVTPISDGSVGDDLHGPRAAPRRDLAAVQRGDGLRRSARRPVVNRNVSRRAGLRQSCRGTCY